MRPIRLRIAGLNSFREVQEVDFAKLCETGVFGIFGSTGSGKSTILDAITLALYGTVERAANNTQGILNHAEDQLTVEFVFSLAAGSSRKIYRAERAFRRSGGRTVKASTCRFIESAEGVERVLASKADEMTKKVEQVLGLTVEDFTRAVVLPQGKFAEFLTIKPKDRRLMLERLFSLEAYGRELTTRLNDELNRVEFNLNGVEQRQQGLGDASEDRVKEAEAELKEALALYSRLTKELTNLQQQFESAKEIWGLQEQLRQSKEAGVQLSALRPNIDKLAERLNMAERAEVLRPILEEIRLSEERFMAAKNQAEEADKRLITVSLNKEQTEKQWSESNQKRLANEPQCLRRLEQLEQAKGLEKDIQVRQERLNEARRKYGELDRRRKELEQKIQAFQAAKAAAEKQQQEVKNQITKITVDPALRAQVTEAAKALEAFELVSRQAEDLQRDLANNTSELNAGRLQAKAIVTEVQKALHLVEELKGNLSARQQNQPVSEEILTEQAQELERFRHRIADIERAEGEWVKEYDRFLKISADREMAQSEVIKREKELEELSLEAQEAAAYIEEKTAEMRELEHQNLAKFLAESLVEGENCPVCGSLHHPLPAQSPDGAILSRVKNDLEQASQRQQVLEGKRANFATILAVAKAQLSAKQELEQSQRDLLAVKQEDKDGYRGELAESERAKDIQALKSLLNEQELKLHNDRLILNQWKTDRDQLNHHLEEAQQNLVESEQRKHTIQAQIASLDGVEKAVKYQLTQLLGEQAHRKEGLDSLRGEIALTDIPLRQKEYAAWDQILKSLNEELTKFDKGLREADEANQRLSLEKTNCELELQNLKTVGSEAAQVVAELKGKWHALTGGRPAQELIEQIKQELALLTAVEEKQKLVYDQAKEKWTQAEQSLAVCLRTLELSREGLELARHKLEQGLQRAQFTTIAEVRSSLCAAEERTKMDQDILAYRQEVFILQQKRAEVEERLKGRSLRPEDWLSWPVRLKKAEKDYTEAIERCGAAQQRLTKLKEEHAEWLRLERERGNLSHRRSLFKTLQSLLKGNAFVEFIAQEQLASVSQDASERLKQLTNQRYALEVDAEGGFIMRDDANGGVRRPVNSLSGGETFLTALALALALSTQIQLRGESPLEFFFLDEGFGTLDANLLETVMNTLEKLHLQNLSIGIISHVPELKNRLARRLLVTPAEAGGAGSKVRLEMA